MAFLAARTTRNLEELTTFVQADPAKGCISGRRFYCERVPSGVAVRAEKPGIVPGDCRPAR